MSIFLINTCEGRTGSLSRWPLSFKQGRPNSAEVTIKKCRKSTNTFQKFSWASGTKTTTAKKLTPFSMTWVARATTSLKFPSCLHNNSGTSLKAGAQRKSNPKQRQWGLRNQKSSNRKIQQRLCLQVQSGSKKWLMRKISNLSRSFSVRCSKGKTNLKIFSTTLTKRTSIWELSFEKSHDDTFQAKVLS